MTIWKFFSRSVCLSLVLLALGCNTYVNIKSDPPDTSGIAIDKKIALVGFKPFGYLRSEYKSGPRERTIETKAYLKNKNSFQQSFKFGKFYKDYPEKGIDSSVSEEKIQKFVVDYAGLVGKNLASQELALMFKADKKGKLSLIKRDVDYYLIGFHGPMFRDQSSSAQKFFSFLIWLGTYTLFPYFESIESDNRFILYDNKLNRIHEFTKNEKFMAWKNWYFFNDDALIDGSIEKDYLIFIEYYKDHLNSELNKKE